MIEVEGWHDSCGLNEGCWGKTAVLSIADQLLLGSAMEVPRVGSAAWLAATWLALRRRDLSKRGHRQRERIVLTVPSWHCWSLSGERPCLSSERNRAGKQQSKNIPHI